jgi:nitrite reductase (NADH) large subunit
VRIVVVGNGLAGTMAGKTARELDPEAEIEILGEESYPYYPRPNLIEFVAGRLPYDKLFAFPDGWSERQRIALRLGEKVIRIRPAERRVETASGAVLGYDALLLATGARAAVPPVPGIHRKGVLVLRTLDDAIALVERLAAPRRVAILGGGLLGLEIARAIRGRDTPSEVEVVEFFDRLLPRQLDPAAAALLKAQFERAGIAVRLGAAAAEILGGEEVQGVRFKSGDVLGADTVIVAAGIKPETAVAAAAGLQVGRGIVVDDGLRTSAPGIFAAGDAAEHRGRIYGIIPAAFEQARAAAYTIVGQDKAYPGTISANALKVAGLYLTSVGEIDAEGPGYESHVRAVPEAGLYKKIVLREGRLAGAIWMGTKKGVTEITRLVALRREVGALKEALLADDFDFTELA